MSAYPSLAEIRQLLGSAPGSPAEPAVTAVCTDTRQLEPGALFVALRGERFDGHDFVAHALQQGAVAAVVERGFSSGGGVAEERLLRVASPLGAYQQLGHWRRRHFGGSVVAVTGSVGKTTTKELCVAALRTAGEVLWTQANYNNEIGVPKTLLDLREEHRYAVIEMGMRGPGQIRELGRIAEPDIAVITNAGTAHIGLLGSREAIARAKCELLETLDPAGVAVLNADCGLLLETAAAVWPGETITFGLQGGDVRGELVDRRRLRVRGQDFTLPLPGAHNALNFLAVLAVAQRLGIAWDRLAELRVELPRGRARRLELRGDIVLLDETYNAGPESMSASLALLAGEPGRRRIAVLGTMHELGEHSAELHRQVGRTVAALGLDALWVLAEPAAAEALVGGATGVACRCFDDHEQLAEHLRRSLGEGDRVLLKGSRAVGLDRVVAALAPDETVPAGPDG